MPFDPTNFNPQNVDDLVEGIGAAVAEAASQWFGDNRDRFLGYTKGIAQLVTQTQVDLAAGIIDQEDASIQMQMHRSAMRANIAGLAYETFELQQLVLNTAIGALGYAVKNLTGINIAPSLVT